MTLFMYQFVFLFLQVHFEFGSGKIRDDKHKSCEHSHIFSKDFTHLKFLILKNSIIDAF
jgi:hypothetical protein